MKQNDIEKSILVQKHQLDKTNNRLADLKKISEIIENKQSSNKIDLDNLESSSEEIAKKLGINRDNLNLDSVSSKINLNKFELEEIENKLSRFRPLETIQYSNWNDYVERVNLYIDENKVDMSIDPIHQLLTAEQYANIDQKYRSQFEKYKWDRWDYIFTGSAGVLASLTDFLLVRVPKDLKYAGKEFKGSPLTKWLKNYNVKENAGGDFVNNDWFANWARALEKKCQVPYDSMTTSINGDLIDKIPGMGGRTHRLQSLGHDPILGFVFGVLDIMRGTISGFSYDKLTGNHNFLVGDSFNYLPGQGPELIEAILIQFGHLISDVATPAGLPAPFMSLFQRINVGNFGPKGRTVGELARWMYLNDYDFRHFLVSGITPAVIEITLRAYIMARHYYEHGETKLLLASNPKYRSMFLCAHSIAAAGNIGKITLGQGNPLCINMPEWIALFRYLLPSLKYWIFDKPNKINQFYESRWELLLQNSQELYNSQSIKDLDMIELGI